ncbi:MAG: bacteriocin fulvocin C-related protein [Acidobacteria bacterium]|nr:bacteriocin fulvocin C-related protein [Acidobacteriota bacterium]MBV9068058.1 bacteriocin fulvocin C-related protein [Acidobacteriota bacterium]MBV9185091.1 bacteriocin fulvocin C-related protein [Acidobacteriota bacterium]
MRTAKMRFVRIIAAVLAALGPGIVFAAKPQVTPSAPPAVASAGEIGAARLYSVIAALTVTDRKAVFRGLSPDVKAAVWRVHLDNFKATHAISPAQVQLIGAIQSFLTPDLFAIPKTDPGWETQVHVPLKMLEDSARTLFPPDMLAAAFAQIGPDDLSVSSSSLSTAASLRPVSGPIAQMVPECTCSEVSDQCWLGTCGGAICYRSEDDSGCGFMWQYRCDSKCRRDS